MFLTTKAGKKYLDLGAGIAVNSLGYGHPKLEKGLISAATKTLACIKYVQYFRTKNIGKKTN